MSVHKTDALVGPADVDVGFNTSDMDCLIVVLRRLYIAYDADGIRDVVAGGHPLFELALGPINDHDGAERQRILDDPGDLDDTKYLDRVSYGKVPPFMRLAEGVSMQWGFWSSDAMVPWSHIKRRDPDSSRPNGFTPWSDYNNVQQDDMERRGPIRFEPGKEADGTTLADVVRPMSGAHQFESFEMAYIPNRRLCIRVHFIPDEKEEWGYARLYRLDAEGHQLLDGKTAPEEGDGPAWDYRLGAVVRMRADGDDGCSFVRLYDTSHEALRVRPENTTSTEASYLNHAWRLGEYGHEYMLYYFDSCFGCAVAPGPEYPVDVAEDPAARKHLMDMWASLDKASSEVSEAPPARAKSKKRRREESQGRRPSPFQPRDQGHPESSAGGHRAPPRSRGQATRTRDTTQPRQLPTPRSSDPRGHGPIPHHGGPEYRGSQPRQESTPRSSDPRRHGPLPRHQGQDHRGRDASQPRQESIPRSSEPWGQGRSPHRQGQYYRDWDATPQPPPHYSAPRGNGPPADYRGQGSRDWDEAPRQHKYRGQSQPAPDYQSQEYEASVYPHQVRYDQSYYAPHPHGDSGGPGYSPRDLDYGRDGLQARPTMEPPRDRRGQRESSSDYSQRRRGRGYDGR